MRQLDGCCYCCRRPQTADLQQAVPVLVTTLLQHRWLPSGQPGLLHSCNQALRQQAVLLAAHWVCWLLLLGLLLR